MVTDLPMSMLHSATEARAVQSAALDAYDSDFRGYALVGTSQLCRNTLGLGEPIFSAIPNKAFHEDPKQFTLPRGMIGAQCELAFTLGSRYPIPSEAIDRRSAADVVVACQPAIGLIGRRTAPGSQSGLIAIADFAFHVATICGPSSRHIDPMELDRLEMVARIDGKVVVTAQANAILGHPLETVTWLARQLSAQERLLNADDIVATGSCGPVLQVLPGQHLTVEFPTLGAVSCRFD